MGAPIHVTPSGLGGWRVERIGSGEAESVDSREEAEARARELAGEDPEESKIVVHDAEGRITDEQEG